MSIKLGANNYGKSGIRLLRVVRQQGRHDIKELTIRVGFEGDFEAAHTKGDNQKILPTDTMKNTVYVLARQYPVEAVEEFALHLIEHFLTYNPQVVACPNRSKRKSLGAASPRRKTARLGLRSIRRRETYSCADWYARRNHDSRRPRRFDCVENDEIRLRRIPSRSLHHAQRGSRSHSIHSDSRGLALRRRRSGIQPCMARRTSNNARDVCRTRQPLASTHALRDGRGSPQQLRSHRRNLSLASQQAFHSRESCSLWNGQSRRSFSAY